MMNAILICLTIISVPVFGQSNLEQLNIDANTITVSGISSGGAFATQYHVIHSSTIMGSAIFAGVVYYCASGLVTQAFVCMDTPNLINVDSLISITEGLAVIGSIDQVAGLSGDMVYIFAGTEDTTVNPDNGPNIGTFYGHFGSNMKTEYTISAEHCQPTDFYGPSCDYSGGEYINNCNYNGAYNGLNYMYGGSLTKANESLLLAGKLLEFNQKEFFFLNSPSTYGMDTSGYIYVPQDCLSKTIQCKLHIVFHGCLQGKEYMDDTFVTKTGYLQVAEANNIIVLFPQAKHELILNPNGCWDWWGYTGILNYYTKYGFQIQGIEDMIDRLVNGN